MTQSETPFRGRQPSRQLCRLGQTRDFPYSSSEQLSAISLKESDLDGDTVNNIAARGDHVSDHVGDHVGDLTAWTSLKRRC